MIIRRIVTVCTANICRSPVAEAVLAAGCPQIAVTSAGLHALVNHAADKTSAEAARLNRIATPPHKARQFTEEIGRENDLILVLGKNHRYEISAQYSQFLGKTFLLGHFSGGRDVPDPYRLPLGQHVRAAELIQEFCADWIKQIMSLTR